MMTCTTTASGGCGKFLAYLISAHTPVCQMAELHIPINTKILCRMRSLDTLHSFWIPNARAKQDIQPDMTIPLWFDSTKLGNWQISGAEYCGVGHTKMAATLIVHTEADYKAWQEKHREEFGPHDPELHKVWKFWR